MKFDIEEMLKGCKYTKTHELIDWYSWPVNVSGMTDTRREQCFGFIFWGDEGTIKVRCVNGEWRHWNGDADQSWI